MTIEIINSELSTEIYSFYFLSGTIFLDSYYISTRKTKRHKFKTICLYNRLRDRDSIMKENEVPLTEEIKKQVLDKYIKTLSVKKWSERNK